MNEAKRIADDAYQALHNVCPVCGETIYPRVIGPVKVNNLHWDEGRTWRGKTCSQECSRLFYARETAELEFNTKFP